MSYFYFTDAVTSDSDVRGLRCVSAYYAQVVTDTVSKRIRND